MHVIILQLRLGVCVWLLLISLVLALCGAAAHTASGTLALQRGVNVYDWLSRALASDSRPASSGNADNDLTEFGKAA